MADRAGTNIVEPALSYVAPQRLHILCKNARLNGEARLAAVLAEVSETAWDIILFSETRAPDSDINLAGGHRLICSRGELKYAGAAILRPGHSLSLSNAVSVSSRILFAGIVIQNSCMRLNHGRPVV